MKDLKLEIKYIPIEDVIPYVNNTRLHSESQIQQIKASIKEFGMCNAIGIHNGTIVYGHGRYEALKQLGYEKIPTINLDHLTDTQRKALVIADNKIGDNSMFDEELLKLEIEALQDEDIDLDVLGFSEEEMEMLLINGDGLTDDFTLKDGDKEPFQQITFTLTDNQADFIKGALDKIQKDYNGDISDLYGNTNKNGNAIYMVVKQWAEQKR